MMSAENALQNWSDDLATELKTLPMTSLANLKSSKRKAEEELSEFGIQIKKPKKEGKTGDDQAEPENKVRYEASFALKLGEKPNLPSEKGNFGPFQNLPGHGSKAGKLASDQQNITKMSNLDESQNPDLRKEDPICSNSNILENLAVTKLNSESLRTRKDTQKADKEKAFPDSLVQNHAQNEAFPQISDSDTSLGDLLDSNTDPEQILKEGKPQSGEIKPRSELQIHSNQNVAEQNLRSKKNPEDQSDSKLSRGEDIIQNKEKTQIDGTPPATINPKKLTLNNALRIPKEWLSRMQK